MTDDQIRDHQRAIDSWIEGRRLYGSVWQGSWEPLTWFRGPDDWLVLEQSRWEIAG